MSLPTSHPARSGQINAAALLKAAGAACAIAWMACAGPGLTWADEDADLNRIPDIIEEAPQAADQPGGKPAPVASTSWRMFLEDGVTGYGYRSVLIPPPGQVQPTWQERLSLDSKGDKVIANGLHLIHSLRYNLFGEDTLIFPSEQSERLDLRELYLSWEAQPQTYIDAGRINLKNGVAVGFNPTDFFKTRAVVDYTSQDPAVQRENRLGTAMATAQTVWDGGSLLFAFAPQLNRPSSIYDLNHLPDFEPMFDRTNGQQRALLKATADLPQDISAEALAYQENDHTKYGLNFTAGLGKEVVAYAEWAGGNRASLITDALAYGKGTGTIPNGAPRLLPGTSASSFQQDYAVGASWTTESKVSTYLEYDYHEAGFTKRDWHNWFAVGQALQHSPIAAAADGELWYVRSYAADQGEPLAQSQIFLRTAWTDAFIPDLELDALAGISQVDDSTQFQATATYFLSDHWTVGALGLFNAGSKRSNYGSLPQDESLLLKVTRYL